jgi:hypothetical protein
MNLKLLFSLIGLVLVLILASFLIGSCSSAVNPPQPTPTSIDGALNAGVALIQQDMYLRLTQQSIENQRIEAGAKMTATQQVFDATATQARYEDNAKATLRAEAATQQAFQVTVAAAQAADTATAEAHATATAQAYVAATTTAESHATSTQWAVVGLTATIQAQGTQIAEQKTQEAPAVAAREAALKAQTEKLQMELEKERANAWFGSWGWVIVSVVLIGALGYFFFKKSQVGVITDADGNVALIMIKDRALQPKLMFDPVLDFTGRQGVMVPELGVTDEIQKQIVHERNIVDAIEALPPGYPRQALGMAAGLSTPASAVNIQVVQPQQVQPWIEDVQGQIAQRSEEDDA